MSKHTHTAIHTVHRRDKSGKAEEIKAGSQFTPVDAAQAKYLEENGAARKNAKAEVEAEDVDTGSNAGKKGDGKKGDGKKGDGNGRKDEELL